MAIVLSTNETPREVTLTTLEDFQQVVGGWIEPIHLANGGILIVNEGGRQQNLPLNLWATTILLEMTNHVDTIMGNAVLLFAEEIATEEIEEIEHYC